MDSVGATFAFALISWALADLRDYFEIRRWDRVKAYAVHWHQAERLGSPALPPLRHETLIVRTDGSEELLSTRPASHPGLTYYAEMVYFLDGAAHAADLAFDEPAGDTYEIRVDPRSPSQYSPGLPSLQSAILHFALGLAALLASL